MLSSRGFIGCSTGIAQAEARAFALFPNPTNGQITLVSDWNASQAMIQVVNFNGQEVFQSTQSVVAGQPLALDLTQLTAGMYIVTMTDGTRSHYSKLIIE